MSDEQQSVDVRDMSWGAPPEPLEQKKRRREVQVRDVLSNIATVLLSAAIIAGGIAMPTLVSPMMDTFKDQTVVLDASETTNPEFELQKALYPWDLVEEGSPMRPLSSVERTLLSEHRVPDFLVSVYDSMGYLPALAGADVLYDGILASFKAMTVGEEQGGVCFVMYDWSGFVTGQPTVPIPNYAVDSTGNVISLRILPVEGMAGAPAVQKPTQDDATSSGDDAEPTVLYPDQWRALGSASSGEEFLLWAYSDFVYREASINGQEALAGYFAALDMNLGQRNGYSELWPAINSINGDPTREAEQDATNAEQNGSTDPATGTSTDGAESQEQDPQQETPGLQAPGQQPPAGDVQANAQQPADPAAPVTPTTEGQGRTTDEDTYVSPLFDVAPPSPQIMPDFSMNASVYNHKNIQLYIYRLQASVLLTIYYDPATQSFVGFNLRH